MSERDTQLSLIAEVADVLATTSSTNPPGVALREIVAADEPALADLYFDAYFPEIVSERRDAAAELARTFEGEYGTLDLRASGAVIAVNRIVAAVMTVHAAPWPGSPPGPFVIEVMVDPAYRRKGLATCALRWTAERLASDGRSTMSLFVMSGNAPARKLYSKLGFASWR